MIDFGAVFSRTLYAGPQIYSWPTDSSLKVLDRLNGSTVSGLLKLQDFNPEYLLCQRRIMNS